MAQKHLTFYELDLGLNYVVRMNRIVVCTMWGPGICVIPS